MFEAVKVFVCQFHPVSRLFSLPGHERCRRPVCSIFWVVNSKMCFELLQFYSVSNLHFFAILFWYCVCTLYQHVFVNGMSHVWCRHEWRWRVPTRPSPDWKKVYDSDSGRLWRHLIRWFRWYDSNDPPKQSGDSGLLVCHVEILKAEEIDEVVPAARSFGFNNTSICDSFIQFHSFGTSRPFKIFLIATACISLCTTWIVWRHSHAESGPYPDMVTVKLYGYWVIAPFNCNVDPFC